MRIIILTKYISLNNVPMTNVSTYPTAVYTSFQFITDCMVIELRLVLNLKPLLWRRTFPCRIIT